MTMSETTIVPPQNITPNETINSIPGLGPTTLDPLNSKNELRFRENMYRLIISQLFYDGYQHAAVNLSGAIQVQLHQQQTLIFYKIYIGPYINLL